MDVDSSRALAGANRCRCRRRQLAPRRHYVAAGALRALSGRRTDRRDHPRARRRPQAWGISRADVQHRDGAAASRSGLARAGWRDGPRRGGAGPRALMARDFRQAEHLPNLRPDRQPAPPEELPRQRNGVTPQMHGRYPDYNVLDEVGHWDDATRRAVLQRVENVPPVRFFTDAEARTLGCFCDVVLAQDSEPKIPVLNMVDAKLFAGKLDGL